MHKERKSVGNPCVIAGLLFFVGLAGCLSAAPKEVSGDFTGDLRALRLDLVKACSQLQAGKPTTDKPTLLAELDALIARWQTMTDTWRDRPPSAYARDTAWPGYFAEALDNFRIMRERAAAGNYRRAAQFCGMNCRLFVNINEVNGIDKTSDRLFHIRMTTRQMMERVRAANWTDADRLLARAHQQLDRLAEQPAADAENKTRFAADIVVIRNALAPVADAVEKRDAAEAGARFGPYLRMFRDIYIKYL